MEKYMSTDRTEGINHNIYALLCEKPQHIVKVTNKIDTILRKAVDDLNKLNKKYPDAGIGDTATDEEIANQFYSILH